MRPGYGGVHRGVGNDEKPYVFDDSTFELRKRRCKTTRVLTKAKKGCPETARGLTNSKSGAAKVTECCSTLKGDCRKLIAKRKVQNWNCKKHAIESDICRDRWGNGRSKASESDESV